MSNEGETCLFCRIQRGDIPSTSVYSSETVYAFRDVNPQAPVHILIIPREHISGIDESAAENGDTLGALVRTANAIAREAGIAQTGYRLVVNSGRDAGQSVPHLHVHLLGGRALAWPPG